MILITLLILFSTAAVFLIKWLREKHRHWEKLNVKTCKPMLIFGHSFNIVLGKLNAAEQLENEYNSFPSEDIIGHYDFLRPVFVIRSPDIVEKILITDFSHFTDRIPVHQMDQSSPMSLNLFTMTGNKWRAMRYKLSPLFTTGKLKFMFDPLAECGKDLVQVMSTKVGKEVDMKELNSLFAMDVIGSCAFGIDTGALRDSSSTFCKMGKKMFDLSFGRVILLVIATLFPKIGALFKITFMKKSVADYFMNVILNTVHRREKTGEERNDFVQLLTQLKEKGSVPMPTQETGDEYLKIDKTDDIQELEVTDNLLAGSAFIFLFAGFHTTAATLTYAFYELARHPEIQERARKEIQEQIDNYGEITYQAVKSMNYLDNVLKETMRLHPAVPVLFRCCTKEYTFSNGLKISPGEGLFISVLGLHKDPAYFPDPGSFNPDRFDVAPQPGTYLPFGEGPRICIAMRFAILEMKFALAKILSTYTISPNERTQTSLKMEPRSFLMTPKGKVVFNLNKYQLPNDT